MRKSILNTAITVVLVSLSTAQATPMIDSAANSSVDIQGELGYKLSPQEFDAFKGSYTLDSGSTLTVWRQGNRFYCQLSKQPVQQLIAKAPDLFETRNGATLRFLEEGNAMTVAVTGYDKLLIARR